MPCKFFRLLLLSLVSAAWVSAQQVPYTLRVDVPLVSVDVFVTDARGDTVNNLSQTDFQILEDGVPQDIRFFSPVSAPYNILLLFDRSGSTQHKWLFMQKAVAGFLSNLRPQDRVSIATFADDLQLLARWTDPRTKAVLALSELVRPRSSGRTEFYRSLERVLRREFRPVSGRRAVVVLSDGRDTSFYQALAMNNRMLSTAQDRDFQRAFKAAREERIPVYFIAISTDRNFELNTQGGDEFRNLQILYPNTQTPQEYLAQVRVRMEEISEVSGGRMVYPRSIEEIVPVYERIGRELGTAYSLGYVSPATESPNAYRRIEVRVKDPLLRVTQSRVGYNLR